MELYSNTEKVILRTLCSDSRASITKLAKAANCSRAAATKNLAELERKLGLIYTLEIDETRLGGSERHLVAIKFADKPSEESLKKFFWNDANAQAVYALDGDYDLLIYARAGDPESYIVWETYVASQLAEYRPRIKPSEFVITHWGFWPLGDSFVSEIRESAGLDALDRRMLSLLNRNSRTSISELARETGAAIGTVRYRLMNLKKSGIIKRFTATVQSPPYEYQMVEFINYRFSKDFEERFANIRKKYLDMDEGRLPLLNKWQIIAPISGSFRSFVMSVYDGKSEAEEGVPTFQKGIFKKDNIEVSYARISSVIKGLLPYRSLEVSKNYVYLGWRGQKKS